MLLYVVIDEPLTIVQDAKSNKKPHGLCKMNLQLMQTQLNKALKK